MKLKIINEKNNELFGRKEILVETEEEVMPKRTDVKKALAEKIKTDEEKIIIKKIDGRFGSKTFNIKANIYNSREELEKIEPKNERKNPSPKIPEPTKEKVEEKTSEENTEIPQEKSSTKEVKEEKTE